MAQAPPPARGFTVLADLIQGIIECACQCSVPRARFADLIQGGGSGANASATPARYSGELIFKLWDRIVRESGDPIVSFRMALVASAKTFGVLGHILPRCATVLDAYRQTERYAALASQGRTCRWCSTERR